MRKSRLGLGLFVLESCEKGELIAGEELCICPLRVKYPLLMQSMSANSSTNLRCDQESAFDSLPHCVSVVFISYPSVAATHRRRSYVFVLNPTFSIDGTYAGNETRYMNHKSQANCSTTGICSYAPCQFQLNHFQCIS